MDPVYKFPASPGTPLFPISPERANRQHYIAQQQNLTGGHITQQLSQSPSLPSLPHYLNSDRSNGHVRGSSDVQGKVAQFNGLAKEAAQRRKDNEAALKRAILGREEAEGESRRLREDNERLRSEVEEGRGRERRVGERVEGLQEELQRLRETQAHERTIFEKEVRRARKEAFKSSSSLVNMQEELKSVRNRYTLMREEMESQRRMKNAKEQEAIQTQCQLTELQEELEVLRKSLSVTEEEREGLKNALREEEVAKAAAEGVIALPISRDDDEFASPRKRRREERQSLKENLDPLATNDDDVELMALKEDLRLEKRLRTKAQEETHFLKMECQFGVCSCRVAERQGASYVHDATFGTPVQESQENGILNDRKPNSMPDLMPIDPALESSLSETTELDQRISDQAQIIFSPNSGTFSKAPSPMRPNFFDSNEPASTALPQSPLLKAPTSPSPQIPVDPLPQTPRPLPRPPIQQPRTISTTTVVPLRADDVLFSPAPNTPGGISREEALEQIRLRRGRARSFAVGRGGTPAKGVDGATRTISAPVGRGS